MYLGKDRKILKYICFMTYFVHFGMIIFWCLQGNLKEVILMKMAFKVPGCALKVHINAYMYIISPLLWR